MMPTIRIEDDVFEGLKRLAEPFTDTPNSVIRRLLVEKRVLAEPQTPASAPRGEAIQEAGRSKAPKSEGLTPQAVYENFLLHVMANQFNGEGEKSELTKAVLALMKSHGFIGPADIVRVSTGETKAENTIAWGRNALKDRGLISRDSPRGVWALTPEGMQEGKKTELTRRSA